MIDYQFNTSSNFTDNKKFCEMIIATLDPEQKHTTGFCDSFGYEITTSYSKANLTFTFRFIKLHSTTGRSNFSFRESIVSCDLEISVTGLNQKHKIKNGNAKFKRIGMKKSIKALVESPFYYKTNSAFDEYKIPAQLNFFKDNFIEYLNLKNGKLKCTIYTLPNDLTVLQKEIEGFVEGWV